MVAVRTVTQADTDAWLEMRRELWPDDTEAEYRAEIEQYFSGGPPPSTRC